MKRVVSIGLIAAAYALELPLMASQSSAAVIKVCELLPKDEVKKLIGGSQVFDMFPPQEEPLGTRLLLQLPQRHASGDPVS